MSPILLLERCLEPVKSNVTSAMFRCCLQAVWSGTWGQHCPQSLAGRWINRVEIMWMHWTSQVLQWTSLPTPKYYQEIEFVNWMFYLPFSEQFIKKKLTKLSNCIKIMTQSQKYLTLNMHRVERFKLNWSSPSCKHMIVCYRPNSATLSLFLHLMHSQVLWSKIYHANCLLRLPQDNLSIFECFFFLTSVNMHCTNQPALSDFLYKVLSVISTVILILKYSHEVIQNCRSPCSRLQRQRSPSQSWHSCVRYLHHVHLSAAVSQLLCFAENTKILTV